MSDYKYDQDLMSILAHDLRTPISSVQGFIDLAQRAGELNEQQEAFIGKALLALSRMETLIDDVMDMQQLEREAELEREPCEIRLLILECLSLLEGFASEKDVALIADIPSDLPAIPGEINLLRQMINNLVSNAIKYNREGGSVTVTARIEGDEFKMSVADNGIGIPAEDMEQVFTPFFRSRNGKRKKIAGSGIGLAIVKKIVEKHGGTIRVESIEDEGTTFFVTLPKA